MLDRRAVLLSTALSTTLVLRPGRSPAAPSVPTFSLKGVPGVSTLLDTDAPRPSGELGVIGRGKDNAKSGRLNFCEKKGCISSFSVPGDDSYIPPWTYEPDSIGAVSSFTSPAKRALAEARERKSLEVAQKELRAVVAEYPGATIVKDEPRYLYAEFEDLTTGEKDDVEFLLSQDSPIVGYRSAPRGRRSDDRRQRERIRALRKELAPNGWKSVGRAVGIDG